MTAEESINNIPKYFRENSTSSNASQWISSLGISVHDIYPYFSFAAGSQFPPRGFKNGLSIPNGSLFVLRTILGNREDLGIWPHRSC